MAASKSAPDDAHPPVEKQEGWWRGKRGRRILILGIIGAIIVIIAVVVGTVFGIRNAQHKGDGAKASSDSIKPGATPPSTPGFTPSPTPSPTASHSAEPTQVADPNFGIGLGASSGPESLLIWRVHEKGEVSWKEPGGEWQTDEDEDRPFNIAPTVVATAEDRRAAFAVDQRGLVVYALYQDDAWDFEDGWTELGTASDITKFGLWRRPTAVSRAEGLIDVFAIDAKKQIVHIHFDGDDWGEWKLIGRSFTGVVSVTTWGKDRLDIFATSDGGAIKHTSWTPDGWAKDWDDLGEPASIDARPVVSPMAVSFEGSDADGEPELQIAVVLTVERRGTFYRLYSGGEWDEDWVVVPASHEGYEFSNTQAVVGGPPEAPVNLFSRGTDNCLHYNSFNGTKWLYWHYLWCYEGESGTTEATYYPTRHLPVAAVLSEDNTVEVVQANVTNELFRLTLQLPLKEGSHSAIITNQPSSAQHVQLRDRVYAAQGLSRKVFGEQQLGRESGDGA